VTTSRDTLLVFAKAPVPGRVKTRLAAEVGAEEATRIYRTMGKQIVDRVRSGTHRTLVCFDPPNALPRFRRWLGTRDLTFWPQEGGDLGERMMLAFRRAFEEADRVCVIGTDVPKLGRPAVSAAFSALERCDVVFGPAKDGGYYLLALRRPVPALFEEISWSTASVLRESLARAQAAGLVVECLEPLDDLDTAADLEKHPRLQASSKTVDK